MNLIEDFSKVVDSDGGNPRTELVDLSGNKKSRSLNEQCMREKNIILSEDQAIELMSNWIIRSTLVVAKKLAKPVTRQTISKILSVSNDQAQSALESLARMGLLTETESGFDKAIGGFSFDENFVNTSDQQVIHRKIMDLVTEKLSSKDVFGTEFFMSNSKVINKNLPKIIAFLDALNEEEDSNEANDVYAFEFSIMKVSKGKGVANENH